MPGIRQYIRIVKNLASLEKAFQKETSRGSSIKETHLSQSPLDQPYFVAVRDGVEIHYMVGQPFRKFRQYISKYNKEREENKQKRFTKRK